jgi:hypothetical protein
MGCADVKVKLGEGKNEVKWLKLAIQDEKGISTFTQQLFLVSKDDNLPKIIGLPCGNKAP